MYGHLQGLFRNTITKEFFIVFFWRSTSPINCAWYTDVIFVLQLLVCAAPYSLHSKIHVCRYQPFECQQHIYIYVLRAIMEQPSNFVPNKENVYTRSYGMSHRPKYFDSDNHEFFREKNL